MAGIAPGLDGFIAAQQLGQQRQAQEIGILSRLAQMQRQQQQDAQAAEMRPLQMDLLRSQVAAQQAQGPLKALEAQERAQQIQARGALSNLLTTGGGPLRADSVSTDEAEALRRVQEADARGQTMTVNVPNPDNVRALTAMAFPKEYGRAQAQALFQQPKPVATSGITRLINERDALPMGHPARSILDQAIIKQTTSQPAAIVNMPRQETKFQEKVGAEFGDIYTGAIKSEFAAPRTIANYDRLGNLLSQVNTGKFRGTITDMKAAAKTMGVDLNAMGIPDDVAPAQATKQISNMLALELRNPAGGAGMPGAMSDKDREFLQQSIPSIENDPGAIGKMIEYRKALAKRDQEVGKMARAYRARTGRFDEGFFDELREFSEKNPLFPSAPTTPSAPAAGGGAWRVIR